MELKMNHINWNLHKSEFTPKDFGNQLIKAVLRQNTIICVSKYSSVLFVIQKTVESFATFRHDKFKTVIISNFERNLDKLEENLRSSTNYNVINLKHCLLKSAHSYDVILAEFDVFCNFPDEFLSESKIDFLIVDNCDLVIESKKLEDIVHSVVTSNPDVRILGITSEFVFNEKKSPEILSYFRLLSKKLNCRLNTYSDFVSSIRYRNSSQNYIVEYEQSEIKSLSFFCREIINLAEDYLKTISYSTKLQKKITVSEESEFLINNFLTTFKNLGFFFIDDILKLFRRVTKELKIKSSTDEEFLILSSTLTFFETVRLMKRTQQLQEQACLNFKVSKLEKVLSAFVTKFFLKGEFFALVFVQNWFIAKILNDFFHKSEIKENRESLKIDFYVSKKPNEYSSEWVKEKGDEVLRRFRNRDINVLITNNVLMNRSDLPKLNLVVNFDKSLSYASFTHLKSKASFNESYFVWLSDKVEETLPVFKQFFELDRMLLNWSFLDEIDRKNYQNSCKDKHVIKANNWTECNNPIFIINRYCYKLPGDSFTRLTTEFDISKRLLNNKTIYECSLKLPINSLIKNVIKTESASLVLAKWKTAKKTVELLKSKNELDDKYLPIGKENVNFLIKHCKIEWQNQSILSWDGRFLLNKKRHIYQKKIAQCFHNAMPTIGSCFLYAIEMTLVNPIPEELNFKNRPVFRPELYNEDFAILINNRINEICSFPIYLRSGETKVTIREQCDFDVLSNSQLSNLMRFHQFLFSNLLNFDSELMVFDCTVTTNNFLIVPVFKNYENNRYDIKWDFVDKIVGYEENLDFLSNETRKCMSISKEDYEDVVVMPWYRSLNDQKYFYVAAISDDKNPMSTFPSELYANYFEYFKAKYNIEIQNKDQFLLDVDGTSLRLNLLSPRYLNKRGSGVGGASLSNRDEVRTSGRSYCSEKKNRREETNYKQFFVPELCNIHPFKASLWKKAVALPCILYRINSFLVAEELRVQIAKAIGVPDDHSKKNWAPVDFKWNLKEKMEKREKDIADKIMDERIKKTEMERSIEPLPEPFDADSENVQILSFDQTNKWDLCGLPKTGNNMETISDAALIAADCSLTETFVQVPSKIKYIGKSEEVTIDETEGVVENCNEHDLILEEEPKSYAETSAQPEIKYVYCSNKVEDREQLVEALKAKPNPNCILEALTMSNANDIINLERAETIGDSELKLRITDYLYVTFPNIHEGYLSHLRSKQVSNFNLNQLGLQVNVADSMISAKFDPFENWLPPCYNFSPAIRPHLQFIEQMKHNKTSSDPFLELRDDQVQNFAKSLPESSFKSKLHLFIPFNSFTEQCIPEKSVADCLEALIGIYLTQCSPMSALFLMTWAGIDVLHKCPSLSTSAHLLDRYYMSLPVPNSPLILERSPSTQALLDALLKGYETFEDYIGYRFQDRSYLLQAFTHASYSVNTLTDCYQRLEFLGDAVLDFLITRHLYQDDKKYSPGLLTDLRSALVNNIIFALIAVRHNFHKYFKHLSHDLFKIINDFVTLQQAHSEHINDDYYFCIGEDGKEIEAPKALGDIFESVAGAIYLDSNRCLDTVWNVYKKLMAPELQKFSVNTPKSPVRELLELEPETSRFSSPKKLSETKGVEIYVEIFGKGKFYGVGRSYRIAKSVAAKQALKVLKNM